MRNNLAVVVMALEPELLRDKLLKAPADSSGVTGTCGPIGLL